MDLIFRDVEYAVSGKPILQKVSGVVKQGEFLAVMGPSASLKFGIPNRTSQIVKGVCKYCYSTGAGKSTLLNALSGRCNVKRGQITLNDKPLNKQLKRKVAYVLQQDIFFPNLTLQETLTYYARLKLPEKMPNSIKLQRVEEILEKLELQKCASTLMGSFSISGLSGGEKKRASIACELLTNPLVMFLDEPTSGLDSAASYNLMCLMMKYTKDTNKTVVATIHQPSIQIFHMFHNLLLLVEGQVGYFGSPDKALAYFSNIGLYCTPNYNPADFILEKLSENTETTELILKEASKARSIDWPTEIQTGCTTSQLENPDRINVVIDDTTGSVNITGSCDNGIELSGVSLTEEQQKNRSLHDSRKSIVTTDVHMDIYINRESKWQTGFWTQYSTLLVRSLKQSSHRLLSKMNNLESIFYAALIGAMWFQIERKEENIVNIMGLFFFSVSEWGFASIFSGLFAFSSNRDVIMRERSSGMYRMSAYYLSVSTSEFLLAIVRPVVYYSVVYWMAGLAPNPAVFFASISVFLLGNITIQSVGMLVGALFVNLDVALPLCTVFMAFCLILGDFIRRDLPVWLSWIQYFSFVKYTYHILFTLEMSHGKAIQCSSANTTQYLECNSVNTTTISGQDILHNVNINLPIWLNLVALFGITVLFRTSAYLVLRFLQTPTKHGLRK